MSKKNSNFKKLDSAEKPSYKNQNKDQNIEQLETENAKLKNAYLEERFYWILVCVILFDMFVFSHMPATWGGPIAILSLQFLGLMVAARKLGVDEVVKITDRILEGWDRQK